MVRETGYIYDVVFVFCFLHVVNYKSVKWELFSADWLRRQNLKTRRVQVPLTSLPWWIVKQTWVRCNFLYLFIILFLLKIPYLLWSDFVTQNITINIFYPPTYLKRQIDVLHDKVGMDVAPYRMSDWLGDVFYEKYLSL